MIGEIGEWGNGGEWEEFFWVGVGEFLVFFMMIFVILL